MPQIVYVAVDNIALSGLSRTQMDTITSINGHPVGYVAISGDTHNLYAGPFPTGTFVTALQSALDATVGADKHTTQDVTDRYVQYTTNAPESLDRMGTITIVAPDEGGVRTVGILPLYETWQTMQYERKGFTFAKVE